METGEWIERAIWMAEFEGQEGKMGGANGSGVGQQCRGEDGGGRELVGIVGSYLVSWPEKEDQKLLIVRTADALDELVGGRRPEHRRERDERRDLNRIEAHKLSTLPVSALEQPVD